MNEAQILAALLASLLGISSTEILAAAAKGQAEANTELQKHIDEYVSEVREVREKEVLGQVKKYTKQQFDVDVTAVKKPSDFKAVFENVKESLAVETPTPDKPITDAMVKQTQAYKDLQTLYEAKVKDLEKAESGFQEQLTQRDLRQMVLGLLPELKAVVPTSADDNNAKLEIVMRGLLNQGYSYESNGQGDYYIKKGDDYLLNGQKVRTTAKELATNDIRLIYGIQQGQQRQNGQPNGQPNPMGGAGGQGGNTQTTFQHFKGDAPKTQDEYYAIVSRNDLPILAKTEVRTYWQQQAQQQGDGSQGSDGGAA